MAKFVDDQKFRQVVPRWRSFEDSLRRGELDHQVSPSRPAIEESIINHLHEEWKRVGGIIVASDLVSSALTLNLGIAVEAAESILAAELAPTSAKKIATAYLADFNPSSVLIVRSTSLDYSGEKFSDSSSRLELHLAIRQTKRKIERFFRNPILWCNLARLYTSLGQMTQAIRAMNIALSLSPQNRFVLRSASRMFLHLGDKDRARLLLSSAGDLKSDPWLLAAEIATFNATEKTSKNMKLGHRILASAQFAPFHLSELASAIGTIEIDAGKNKAGHRLIVTSMKQPSENSLAQAAWLERREGNTHSKGPGAVQSSEVNAWVARMNSDWVEAMNEYRNWQNDEPFSSKPAFFGMQIAGTALEDYDLTAEMASHSLVANPDDAALHNNHAWALALGGRLAEAERAIDKTSGLQINDSARIILSATRGLIAFRNGNVIAGRLLYLNSIEEARRQRDSLKENDAIVRHAIEEIRARTPDAEVYKKKGIEASKNLTDPVYGPLIKKLSEGEAVEGSIAGTRAIQGS